VCVSCTLVFSSDSYDRSAMDFFPTLSDSGKAHDYPSEALWSVYISEAAKYDTALVERWRDDMDGLLIFVSNFF